MRKHILTFNVFINVYDLKFNPLQFMSYVFLISVDDIGVSGDEIRSIVGRNPVLKEGKSSTILIGTSELIREYLNFRSSFKANYNIHYKGFNTK